MPRPQRLRLVGIAQHVVQRGIDRQAISFGDADRRLYLECLSETAGWYGLTVHAYCLMTNHVLGGARFREQVAAKLGRRLGRGRPGRRCERRGPDRQPAIGSGV